MDHMAELPSDVLFNIFSRMPVKSLARCRCVSKLWCECINDPHLAIIHGERSPPEEPKPIMYYGHSNPPCIVSFHITKSNETTTLLEDKTDPRKQFKCNQSRHKPRVTMVRGSCNGLIYASQDHVLDKLSLVVIHPVRGECHELPPIDPCFPWPCNLVRQKSSCGLGFDASTNTFKMVCVLSVDQAHLDMVRMTQCTMVHVLGTNSWRKIPKIPPLPITGDGVFADGCLHWLNKDAARPLVTCFDVKEEEFRLINRPKKTGTGWMLPLVFHELVDLHGEVGYSYHYLLYKIEVWVLKEKEWVMRYVIDLNLPYYARYIKVVGRWNREGDVLIQMETHPGARVRWFVYSLKSGLWDDVKIVHEGGKYNKYIYMYPAGDLLSILGINTKIAL